MPIERQGQKWRWVNPSGESTTLHNSRSDAVKEAQAHYIENNKPKKIVLVDKHGKPRRQRRSR